MRLSARFINAGFSLLSGFSLSSGILLLLLTIGQTAAYARSPDFLACGAAVSPGAGSCDVSADSHPRDVLPESLMSPGSLMLAKGGRGGGRPAPRPTPKSGKKDTVRSGSSGNLRYYSSGSAEKPGKSERYSTWGSPEKPFDECEWCEDCSDPECEDCEDCEE
ncbi:hypothetical protein [Succinimonas sp.]|uniref:hypothetical protein n=1 Tax=Succinimonas sp. TaxID=1936151 RepID=UPI003869BEE0